MKKRPDSIGWHSRTIITKNHPNAGKRLIDEILIENSAEKLRIFVKPSLLRFTKKLFNIANEGFWLQIATRFFLNQTKYSNDSECLIQLFSNTYKQIHGDKDFRNLPSILPELLSPSRDNRGHYFYYLPPNKISKVIIAMHGYGGNGLYYLWFLKENFPDCAIISPTWGLRWSDGCAKERVCFIKEVYDDFLNNNIIPKNISKPVLIGLSDGGAAAFELLVRLEPLISAYVSLASFPAIVTRKTIPSSIPILMISGTQDQMFSIERTRELFLKMKKINENIQLVEIDANHFFILSHSNRTGNLIKKHIFK
jgi:predicted esterase